MSCAVSCSTDSGVKKPATVRTFVDAGAATTDGAGAGSAAAVSAAAEERRSTRWQAAMARPTHTMRALIGAPPSRRLGLRELLLPLFHDLLRHVGGHLLVLVKLLPIGAPAVGERVQHRRVAVELRLGNERLDLGEPAVLLGT